MRDFDAIKKKEMSSIENQIRHIYNVGYEDCLKDQQKVKDESYKQGLKDAWECCKRFWQSDENTCRDIFNIICWEDFFDLSPSEAIEKFKEYDGKKNCIERCFKNCKHSEKGMVGSTERCESCYYDGVSKANTLFEPMETDNSKIKVGDIVETRGFSKPVIVINTPFDFEDSDEIKVMNYLGDTAWVKIGNCSMTGRYIDKLAETFEQLKNE